MSRFLKTATPTPGDSGEIEDYTQMRSDPSIRAHGRARRWVLRRVGAGVVRGQGPRLDSPRRRDELALDGAL